MTPFIPIESGAKLIVAYDRNGKRFDLKKKPMPPLLKAWLGKMFPERKK